MKNRLAILQAAAALAAAVALAPASASAQTAGIGHRVTASTEGAFASAASLGGVSISAAESGLGISLWSDGTATGTYQALLLGTTALGAQQNIDVEGQAQTGALNADGSVTLGGTSSVDMGDGTPATTMTFTLTVAAPAGGAATMLLALGSTTFPLQTVTTGGVTIMV
jgi:hypothetical protein